MKTTATNLNRVLAPIAVLILLCAGAAYMTYFYSRASYVDKLAWEVDRLTPQDTSLEAVRAGLQKNGIQYGELFSDKTASLVTFSNEVKFIVKPGETVLYSIHPTGAGRTPWDEQLDMLLVFDAHGRLARRYIGKSHIDWR